MPLRACIVYILASRRRTLYVGVTTDLHGRLAAHRAGTGSGFTRKYRTDRLVYVESCARIGDALRREKQLKGWRRSRKIALIEKANPSWDDLSEKLRGLTP